MNAKTPLIASLDGLRAIACFLVFMRHVGLWFPGAMSVIDFTGWGYLGVFLFFTLSGFLMTYHYLPGKRSQRYWLDFLIRRFFRIYPAFFIATLLCVAVHPLFPFAETTHFVSREYVVKQLLFIKGYGWFWTVRLEVYCYVALMLLAVALLYFAPQRYTGLIVTLCLLLPISLLSYHTSISMRPFLSFVAGMTAGYLYKDNLAPAFSRHLWIALAALTFIAIFMGLYGYIPGVVHPWHHAFFAPLLMLALLSIVQAGGRLDWLLANRPMRAAARVSYSFYLTHELCLGFIAAFLLPLPYALALALVLSLSVATILYYAVEKPGIHLGKQLAGRYAGAIRVNPEIAVG